MIGEIISRNEVVLSTGWRSDIETCPLSQCGEQRRITRRLSAGLQAALINSIACEIRFNIRIPRQGGSPRSTRAQHKNSSHGSHPVHSDTLRIVLGSRHTVPEKPIFHVLESMPGCSADWSSAENSKIWGPKFRSQSLRNRT